jgi:hypothetical protein
MFSLKSSFCLILFSSLLAIGCKQKSTRVVLYPIDSLVDSQIIFLNNTRATLDKQATIGDEKDELRYKPDSLAWTRELSVLRQLADINKAAGASSYERRDNLDDQGSNLKIMELTTSENLPIKSLKIFYQGSATNPRRVEAIFARETALSRGKRLLTMEFQLYDNKTILNSYSVEGGQRMIFGDTVAYVVKGRVILD